MSKSNGFGAEANHRLKAMYQAAQGKDPQPMMEALDFHLPALLDAHAEGKDIAKRELFDQLWKALYPMGVEHGPHVVAFLGHMNELQAELSQRRWER